MADSIGKVRERMDRRRRESHGLHDRAATLRAFRTADVLLSFAAIGLSLITMNALIIGATIAAGLVSYGVFSVLIAHAEKNIVSHQEDNQVSGARDRGRWRNFLRLLLPLTPGG